MPQAICKTLIHTLLAFAAFPHTSPPPILPSSPHTSPPALLPSSPPPLPPPPPARQHVCAEEVTHGWLADSIEKYSGLKFIEDEWQHGDTAGRVGAGAIVFAYLVLIVLLITGIYCCAKQGHCSHCASACADEKPVISTFANNYEQEQAEIARRQDASSSKASAASEIELTEVEKGGGSGPQASQGNVA